MSEIIDVSAQGGRAAGDRLAAEVRSAPVCAEVLCIGESVDSVLSQLGTSSEGRPLRWETIAAVSGRVLLSIRAGRCPARRADSVLEFMRAEHARVHSLTEALADAASRGDHVAVRVRLGLLDRVIRRHMELEEAHLMPIIASRHGQPRGPAAVLRQEHVEVLVALERLRDLVAEEAVTTLVEAEARALRLLLHEHGEREEGLIYELADLHLDDDERASFLDFCRAQP